MRGLMLKFWYVPNYFTGTDRTQDHNGPEMWAAQVHTSLFSHPNNKTNR